MKEKIEEIIQNFPSEILNLPCPLKGRCEIGTNACALKDISYCLPLIKKKKGRCKYGGENGIVVYQVNDDFWVCKEHLKEIILWDILRQNWTRGKEEVAIKLIEKIFSIFK